MTTTTTYALRFTNGGEPSLEERRDISAAYNAWQASKEENSADDEIEAAYELIEQLMSFASIEVDEEEYEECDECDEEATCFWPKLNPPVQFCDSCYHDAHRSGWEPGQ